MSYFELGEAEHIFQESVRDFIEQEIRPYVLTWEKQGFIPRTLWKKLGNLGYLGIRYPEAIGGGGASYLYTYLLFKTLGSCGSAGVALAIGVQSEMSIPALAQWGNVFLRENFLIPAFQGEKIGSVAVTEPSGGSNVASIRTTAKKEGAYYRINGQKTFITNATQADFFTLLARTSDAPGYQSFSLFMVPRETPGLSVGKALDKICYPASDTAEVFLQDVMLSEANLIGEEGKGFQYQMEQFQWERLVGVILSLGAMQRCYQLTKQYCLERAVFDKPLIAFQVTQHTLAELCSKIALIEAMTEMCVVMAMRNQNFTKEVSMLKLLAASTQMEVLEACAQLHGGNGLMTEYEVARYFRDAKLLSIGGGTNEIMKEIIVKYEGLRDFAVR